LPPVQICFDWAREVRRTNAGVLGGGGGARGQRSEALWGAQQDSQPLGLPQEGWAAAKVFDVAWHTRCT
jgi:hypothetical protein